MIISMKTERVLMAFLVAVAFALLLTVLTHPIPVRAALVSGMTPAEYADTPNVRVDATVPATGKAVADIPNAHAQPIGATTTPVKTISKDGAMRARQLAQIAELIRQIQVLLALLNK